MNKHLFFWFSIYQPINVSSYPHPFLCLLALSSVVEEHAENQSTTLGQSIETSADPTASLVPSELDLTELGQTDSILPPTESQQVHAQTHYKHICQTNLTLLSNCKNGSE